MNFSNEKDQSEKATKEAHKITKLLEKSGYDDSMVILRKGKSIGIAVSDMDSNFAPDVLNFLYSNLSERNKIVFAMNLLNIDIDGLIKNILEKEQEDED